MTDTTQLIADLRQASNSVKLAADVGIEEGLFDAEEGEGDYELSKSLLGHAQRLEVAKEDRCEMVRGWKIADDGESPGDEIYCDRKAEAVAGGVRLCGGCFIRMYLEESDLVKDCVKIDE